MPQPWPLSLELLRWTPRDPWTLGQSMEGVLILGAMGSGKTSGPFSHVMRALLRCGCGGLFLCYKNDAAHDYQTMIDQEGRSADVIHFRDDPNTPPYAFNFLTYEANHGSESGAIIENIVAALMQANEVLGRSSSNSADPFWDDAMRKLLRNCLEVAIDADDQGRVDLSTISEMVVSLPQSSLDVRMSDDLLAIQLLEKAEWKRPERQRELSLARRYFTVEWPRMADRMRSSIAEVLSVLLDAFVRDPIRKLLLGQMTCSPDDILAGKIVIVDVPIQQYKRVAKIAGVIWKNAVQRAIEARVDREGKNNDAVRPVFIAADEAQAWATWQDQEFQNVARSARGIAVYATQNLPNFFAEMGADAKGKERVKSLLANLQTRLFCQNSDPETNTWASDTIGKIIVKRTSRNKHHWFGHTIGINESEQVDYDLHPRAFTTLKRGGQPFGYQVEAIVTAQSQVFQHNGRRWVRASFHQKEVPPAWRQWLTSTTAVAISAPRFRTPPAPQPD